MSTIMGYQSKMQYTLTIKYSKATNQVDIEVWGIDMKNTGWKKQETEYLEHNTISVN